MIDVLNEFARRTRRDRRASAHWRFGAATRAGCRLLDGTARLGQRLVLGGPGGRAVGDRPVEHVEGDVVELTGDVAQARREVGITRSRGPPRSPRRRGPSGGGRRRRRRRGASRSRGSPRPRSWRRCVAAARSIAASLRSRIARRQLRLQRRVGAAGPAAQALVVELDDVDVAERGPDARHLRRAARGADGTGPARSPAAAGRDRAGRSSTRSASHSWTSRTLRGERLRLGGVRAGVRSPSSPPRTRRS